MAVSVPFIISCLCFLTPSQSQYIRNLTDSHNKYDLEVIKQWAFLQDKDAIINHFGQLAAFGKNEEFYTSMDYLLNLHETITQQEVKSTIDTAVEKIINNLVYENNRNITNDKCFNILKYLLTRIREERSLLARILKKIRDENPNLQIFKDLDVHHKNKQLLDLHPSNENQMNSKISPLKYSGDDNTYSYPQHDNNNPSSYEKVIPNSFPQGNNLYRPDSKLGNPRYNNNPFTENFNKYPNVVPNSFPRGNILNRPYTRSGDARYNTNPFIKNFDRFPNNHRQPMRPHKVFRKFGSNVSPNNHIRINGPNSRQYFNLDSPKSSYSSPVLSYPNEGNNKVNVPLSINPSNQIQTLALSNNPDNFPISNNPDNSPISNNPDNSPISLSNPIISPTDNPNSYPVTFKNEEEVSTNLLPTLPAYLDKSTLIPSRIPKGNLGHLDRKSYLNINPDENDQNLLEPSPINNFSIITPYKLPRNMEIYKNDSGEINKKYEPFLNPNLSKSPPSFTIAPDFRKNSFIQNVPLNDNTFLQSTPSSLTPHPYNPNPTNSMKLLPSVPDNNFPISTISTFARKYFSNLIPNNNLSAPKKILWPNYLRNPSPPRTTFSTPLSTNSKIRPFKLFPNRGRTNIWNSAKSLFPSLFSTRLPVFRNKFGFDPLKSPRPTTHLPQFNRLNNRLRAPTINPFYQKSPVNIFKNNLPQTFPTLWPHRYPGIESLTTSPPSLNPLRGLSGKFWNSLHSVSPNLTPLNNRFNPLTNPTHQKSPFYNNFPSVFHNQYPTIRSPLFGKGLPNRNPLSKFNSQVLKPHKFPSLRPYHYNGDLEIRRPSLTPLYNSDHLPNKNLMPINPSQNNFNPSQNNIYPINIRRPNYFNNIPRNKLQSLPNNPINPNSKWDITYKSNGHPYVAPSWNGRRHNTEELENESHGQELPIRSKPYPLRNGLRFTKPNNYRDNQSPGRNGNIRPEVESPYHPRNNHFKKPLRPYGNWDSPQHENEESINLIKPNRTNMDYLDYIKEMKSNVELWPKTKEFEEGNNGIKPTNTEGSRLPHVRVKPLNVLTKVPDLNSWSTTSPSTRKGKFDQSQPDSILKTNPEINIPSTIPTYSATYWDKTDNFYENPKLNEKLYPGKERYTPNQTESLYPPKNYHNSWPKPLSHINGDSENFQITRKEKPTSNYDDLNKENDLEHWDYPWTTPIPSINDDLLVETPFVKPTTDNNIKKKGILPQTNQFGGNTLFTQIPSNYDETSLLPFKNSNESILNAPRYTAVNGQAMEEYQRPFSTIPEGGYNSRRHSMPTILHTTPFVNTNPQLMENENTTPFNLVQNSLPVNGDNSRRDYWSTNLPTAPTAITNSQLMGNENATPFNLVQNSIPTNSDTPRHDSSSTNLRATPSVITNPQLMGNENKTPFNAMQNSIPTNSDTPRHDSSSTNLRATPSVITNPQLMGNENKTPFNAMQNSIPTNSDTPRHDSSSTNLRATPSVITNPHLMGSENKTPFNAMQNSIPTNEDTPRSDSLPTNLPTTPSLISNSQLKENENTTPINLVQNSIPANGDNSRRDYWSTNIPTTPTVITNSQLVGNENATPFNSVQNSIPTNSDTPRNDSLSTNLPTTPSIITNPEFKGNENTTPVNSVQNSIPTNSDTPRNNSLSTNLPTTPSIITNPEFKGNENTTPVNSVQNLIPTNGDTPRGDTLSTNSPTTTVIITNPEFMENENTTSVNSVQNLIPTNGDTPRHDSSSTNLRTTPSVITNPQLVGNENTTPVNSLQNSLPTNGDSLKRDSLSTNLPTTPSLISNSQLKDNENITPINLVQNSIPANVDNSRKDSLLNNLPTTPLLITNPQSMGNENTTPVNSEQNSIPTNGITPTRDSLSTNLPTTPSVISNTNVDTRKSNKEIPKIEDISKTSTMPNKDENSDSTNAPIKQTTPDADGVRNNIVTNSDEGSTTSITSPTLPTTITSKEGIILNGDSLGVTTEPSGTYSNKDSVFDENATPTIINELRGYTFSAPIYQTDNAKPYIPKDTNKEPLDETASSRNPTGMTQPQNERGIYKPRREFHDMTDLSTVDPMLTKTNPNLLPIRNEFQKNEPSMTAMNSNLRTTQNTYPTLYNEQITRPKTSHGGKKSNAESLYDTQPAISKRRYYFEQPSVVDPIQYQTKNIQQKSYQSQMTPLEINQSGPTLATFSAHPGERIGSLEPDSNLAEKSYTYNELVSLLPEPKTIREKENYNNLRQFLLDGNIEKPELKNSGYKEEDLRTLLLSIVNDKKYPVYIRKASKYYLRRRPNYADLVGILPKPKSPNEKKLYNILVDLLGGHLIHDLIPDFDSSEEYNDHPEDRLKKILKAVQNSPNAPSQVLAASKFYFKLMQQVNVQLRKVVVKDLDLNRIFVDAFDLSSFNNKEMDAFDDVYEYVSKNYSDNSSILSGWNERMKRGDFVKLILNNIKDDENSAEELKASVRILLPLVVNSGSSSTLLK